jgi:hypothetical protein
MNSSKRQLLLVLISRIEHPIYNVCQDGTVV